MLKRALIGFAVVAVVFGASSLAPILGSDTDADGNLKDYRIERADIAVELNRDGSLDVTEALRFDFDGDFTGAYRDIPLRGAAKISRVSVSEAGGSPYQPGGSTELGGFDLPNRFGVTEIPEFQLPAGAAGGTRVVWHYRAADEDRDFILRYRVDDAVIAYQDVVDVGWFVWGDQWDFTLDHLDATMTSETGAAPLDSWLEPWDLGGSSSFRVGYAIFGPASSLPTIR